MLKRMLAALLVAALAGTLACACAEEAEPRRGAYIRYMNRWEGTATEIYAADGTLLYPFGELTAWRDVDQRIHAWGDDGEVVLDADGRVVEYPADMDGPVRRRGEPAFDTSPWEQVEALPTGESEPLRFAGVTIVRGEQPVGDAETAARGVTTWSLPVKSCELLDETGNVIGETPFGSHAWDGFFDGLMLVQIDGRWGFMDLDGRLIVPAEYDEATSFYGGRAVLYRGGDDARQGAFFLTDTGGSLTPVTPPVYSGDPETDVMNLAEYYGCARGYRWDF